MTEAVGPDGLLLVDKPAGITSHDAVDHVRRALGTRKVGHAGTLDPMATGLLLMGVGRATRLLRFLGDLPKTYDGTLRLGVETTTLDADGEVTSEAPVGAVSPEDVGAAMALKLGVSDQRPPAYSAVKVAGRKLYDAARAGEALEAAPRPIRVDRFDVVTARMPDVDFVATVSSGTYIRVLAAEVGTSLGCGAHLVRLRRVAIGPFGVDRAAPPDVPGPLLPLAAAVAHLPAVELEADEAEAAGHGRVLGPAGIDGPYAVFGPGGSLLGIWLDDGGKARPEMVIAPSERGSG